MMSVFAIFLLELFAYRIGVEMFEKMGIELHDTHGPGTAHVSAANVYYGAMKADVNAKGSGTSA